MTTRNMLVSAMLNVQSRDAFFSTLDDDLMAMRQQSLEKIEPLLVSRQGPRVVVRDGGDERSLLNFCSNNYLGLANHPDVVAGAQAALERWGAGSASVRFICGTNLMHKELEAEIARYTGHEDALVVAACYDANAAVFEPLLSEQDAIVSDRLNHASIIDGIRLSRARRYRFPTGDMHHLEARLQEARASGARRVMIATDGVFSMDGTVANIAAMTGLARRYEAILMVDDCHATGHLGPNGRGSAAMDGLASGVDILTGTFGKTLGGSMGGFVCARREVIETLRQRARPYLFSNALAPSICGAALAAIGIAGSSEGDRLREKLQANVALFRDRMTAAGFVLGPGRTPIIPIMFGDAALAQSTAASLHALGLLVTAFSYPVVPAGEARIRVQITAAHDEEDILFAVTAFERVLAMKENVQ